MKQNLNIGNMVDDGTGDYLREGGSKINSNFNELYNHLGDGSVPHAAGAWKTISSKNGTVVNVEFGAAYVVDTSSAQVQINLPKGSSIKYNQVIKLRDVFGTWQTNSVIVSPALGDTIKGSSKPKVFSTNLSDLELVYCSPGRWEYVGTKQLNKISNSDTATILRKEFIATEGQTDFLNVFGENIFNLLNTHVYRRGNLLYYGTSFSQNSDYGSVGANGSLVALDGSSIKLREKCSAGDAITVITYLDGVAQWRSTYNRLDVTILDKNKTTDVTLDGAKIVSDLSTLTDISIEELGYKLTDNSGLINQNTLEVYVNGVFLNEAGSAGLPMFKCENANADNQEDCIFQNGTWTDSKTDYALILDDNNLIQGLSFDREFEHGDIITIKWFNNDIGTTLTIDEITEVTDDKYVSSQTINLSGDVRITDYDNPTWPNVEYVGEKNVEISSPFSMFDLVYPVGTIYENAVNPNNPSTYMGFGSWVLFGEKRTTIGWTNDNQDNLFHFNNNHLDSSNNPNATAGGTGGSRSLTLTNDNLPISQTNEKVLVVDNNGTVVVGGCQFDPDEQGPAYSKYREDEAIINKNNSIPKQLNILPPYITVYRWMRIA